MAGARAHEPFLGNDDGHRFVEHLHFDGRALGFFDQRAPRIAVLLRVVLDLARHLLAQRGVGAEQLAQRCLVLAQLRQLLLDPDAFEPRQLAQADLEDVLGLALA